MSISPLQRPEATARQWIHSTKKKVIPVFTFRVERMRAILWPAALHAEERSEKERNRWVEVARMLRNSVLESTPTLSSLSATALCGLKNLVMRTAEYNVLEVRALGLRSFYRKAGNFLLPTFCLVFFFLKVQPKGEVMSEGAWTFCYV